MNTTTAISNSPTITPKLITSVVCRELNVAESDLKTPSRDFDLVRARNMIWFFMNELCGATSQKSGLLFNRDHSTVIIGLKKFRQEIDLYPYISARVDEIQQAIIKEAKSIIPKPPEPVAFAEWIFKHGWVTRGGIGNDLIWVQPIGKEWGEEFPRITTLDLYETWKNQ